jgi:hypothetical protein
MHVSLCDKYTGLKIEKENLSNNACRIKRGTKLLRIKCSLSRTLVSFLLLLYMCTAVAPTTHSDGSCFVALCTTHTPTPTHTQTQTQHTQHTRTRTRADTCMYTFVYLNFLSKV